MPWLTRAFSRPVRPTPSEAFDAGRFLDDNGTLYLVGSTGAQLSVAPLVADLVEDVVDSARRRGASSPSGRLDPPLLLMLDEAANIAPIPSLQSLLCGGGRSGITTMAVLRCAPKHAHGGATHTPRPCQTPPPSRSCSGGSPTPRTCCASRGSLARSTNRRRLTPRV